MAAAAAAAAVDNRRQSSDNPPAMAKRGKKVEALLQLGNPCHACGAACCRYVAVALTPPRDEDDRDLFHWYLSHAGVCIYIDKDQDWWIQVGADCRHIVRDGGCGIYESRPRLCRKYGAEACERADPAGDNIAEFTTVEEFERFFAENYRVAGDKIRRTHRRLRAPAP